MKVKSLKPNGYGLYDMAGNVWEWCWDWHASGYYGTIGKNPVGPQSGRMRVGRGGGWNNQSENCAVFYRDAFDPADSRTNYGFRLAVSARESGGEAATRVEK
jgi:formylglycine-generating enzyme required for sulfatase activity